MAQKLLRYDISILLYYDIIILLRHTNKKLGINLEISSTKDKYYFIKKVLLKFRYVKLDKADKHIILKYLKYSL